MENNLTSKQPSNLITIKEAKNQLENFKKAHPKYNGNEYALRSWISLEALEEYLEFVKKTAVDKKIKITGIEFIYTQYKEGKPNMENASNADYELTLMFAPTTEIEGKNVGIDVLNSEKDQPLKLSDILVDDSEDGSESNPNLPDPNKLSGVANQINSCPNMCL